jgi:anti-sigma regulatory factor (Ser/Thr protein kinase)
MGIALLTVCGNIQLLAVAFFSAGGQAALPLEGVLFGERDYAGLRLLMRYVFRIIIGCVAAIIVIICLFPSQIVALFVPEGIEGADWLLRLYAIGFAPLAANYVMTYYYNTIQQRNVAMTLTLCENLVFYLPLIWVLTHAFGLVGAVASFVIAEVLSFATMLLMADWVRRKKGFADLMLLPDVPREMVLGATVPASEIDASGIAHEVKRALDECGVESDISLRAAIGVEEMVVNAAHFGKKGKRDTSFDVIVSSLPECVQISLRDNGVPFDPTNYKPEESEEFNIDGIQMLHAVATSVDYRFTLGLNQTIIEIRK